MNMATKNPAADPDITVDMAVEETWMYAGTRLLSTGKLSHAWCDRAGDGHEVLYVYKRGERYIIGGLYTCRIGRKDNRVIQFGQPTYTGEYVDSERRQLLELKQHAAQNRLEAQRREANDARRTALDEAVAPLQEIARKATSNAQRDALLSYVIRKLTKEW